LIQIESRWEEGHQEVLTEEVVYDKLGLRKEDKRAVGVREEAYNTSIPVASMNEVADEFVCEDQPDDTVDLCDCRNHVMSLGS
jgi:hypothetical protein